MLQLFKILFFFLHIPHFPIHLMEDIITKALNLLLQVVSFVN